MERYCDTCGTKLPGKKGHGFVTEAGGLSCGRSQAQRTTIRNGAPSLGMAPLPCASATRTA